jgi:hypothetical protein
MKSAREKDKLVTPRQQGSANKRKDKNRGHALHKNALRIKSIVANTRRIFM